MLLRTRLLRTVSGDCGPANKNVLRGIAKAHGQLPSFTKVLRALLDLNDELKRFKPGPIPK